MSVKERVIEFIRYLGISQRSFEIEIGVSKQIINKLFRCSAKMAPLLFHDCKIKKPSSQDRKMVMP